MRPSTVERFPTAEPSRPSTEQVASPVTVHSAEALSPFKEVEWRSLSPAERLERAWALRARLVDPQGVHDRKLFPSP